MFYTFMQKITTKIPNILFYNPPNTNSFRMIDRKKSAYIGEMSVLKRKVLFLESFHIFPDYRKQGYGKKFLDFAVNLSKKLGLNGNLRVLAAVIAKDSDNPPHIFYRKYGFTSDNKKILKQIDEAIKNKQQLHPFNTPPLYMYYNK